MLLAEGAVLETQGRKYAGNDREGVNSLDRADYTDEDRANAKSTFRKCEAAFFAAGNDGASSSDGEKASKSLAM